MKQGRFTIGLGVLLGVTAAASAQPLGGNTEWVTIGAVGNKGLDRYEPGWELALGCGAVNYEYRMATTEVTTGQWMEFMNAVNGTREDGTRFLTPTIWGAWHDNGYSGPGARFELRPDRGPNAARLPVGGIGWRDSARYVNWLHNGKQMASASMASGAYDTSTFGLTEDATAYTDQHTRSDGARFWIPSLDELIKAVHYDPAKDNGDGTVGGWWAATNGTDELLPIGLPEDGGLTSGGLALEWEEVLPVGSYDVTTPWGLYDASGSMREWTESVDDPKSRFQFRFFDGSFAGQFTSNHILDQPWVFNSTSPTGTAWTGLRIAGVVPSPGTVALGAVWPLLMFSRRRNG